jgi:hypothetical protein
MPPLTSMLRVNHHVPVSPSTRRMPFPHSPGRDHVSAYIGGCDLSRVKRMSEDQVNGAPIINAATPITNCPNPMLVAKTSMLSDDSTAMASHQPPRRATARNGDEPPSQSHPTFITPTAINK